MTITEISASLAKSIICEELDVAKMKVVGKSDGLVAIYLQLPRRAFLSGHVWMGPELGGSAAIRIAA